MASHASSSVRAIQKKLRKIVKDVMKMEEMDGVLDGVLDSIPAMDIFMDEDGIDKYGEDLLAFKAEVEKCCKFISKMRGKKANGPAILEEFSAQLEQEFPDVFAPAMEVEEAPMASKKRGRPSLESSASLESPERQPKKKAAKHEEDKHHIESGLSAAEKTALKSIIGKLSKAPEAEYFLYPVDANAYPEYYAQIAHPMDLATAKQKLNAGEYATAQEALQDLRQVWENCRLFNAEGSDILLSAEACAELLEALVEEKLGEEYLQPKKKVRGKGRKSLAAMEGAAEDTSAVAEGKTPKQKRKRGSGSSAHLVEQEGWPLRPRSLWPLPEGFVLGRAAMKALTKEVSSSEFASPFLEAVDPDEAPGYLDMIETPMDLGTLKKRITSGAYDGDGALFVSDMRLVWENCVTYNDPASDIAAFAASLGEVFEEQLGALLVEMGVDDQAAVDAAAVASAGKTKAKKVKDEPAGEDDGGADSAKKGRKPKAHSGEDGVAEEAGEGEAKKPLSANIRKMKKILKAMYADDRSLPFREPVPVDEVPGYAEMISQPMDLSTVKANLAKYDDTPGKFLRDMRLIFDNCQKFNLEESEIYQNAGRLRDMVDALFTEHFPPIDHAAESAMKIKIAAKARKASVVDEEGEEAAAAATVATTLKLPKALQALAGVSTGGSSSASREAETSSMNLPQPKVTARFLSLPTKLEDLTALVAELSNSATDAAQNTYVRERAFHRAYEKLRATRLPFVVAPELYTVRKFGDLYPDYYKCHDAHHIYPIGYSCSRTMRICLVPEAGPAASSEPASSVKPWVAVELRSSVFVGEQREEDAQLKVVDHNGAAMSADATCDQPRGKSAQEVSSTGGQARRRVAVARFQVTLENGTVLTEASTPRAAWEQLLGKELQVMAVLGGKLKRCRAVFNRLAVSPDALPFLEMVPLTGPVGQSYYAITTAPMWFREVHSRLVEGTYDVEFDFAWDMRLIFKNCTEYNQKGSELYAAAERLSESFEHLFAQWVLNVQDRSLEDLAKGPWDSWQTLRFFDFPDPTANICSITGDRAPASHMLQCRCCEDQILATLHAPVHNKSMWVCARCQEALDMAGGDLTGNPFAAVGFKNNHRTDTYSCEEFGGNVYVPAPEFGAGWNQAKRRMRAGLKNTFLSPLGYEVPSKEDILNQVVYEDVVNQNLYAARAAEFQEFIKAKGPRVEAKKTARHRRATSSVAADPTSPEKGAADDVKASTTSAPAIDPLAAEEVGRIPSGKLHAYFVPPGHRLAWFTCADEAAALQKAKAGQDISSLLNDRVEMRVDLLPPSGYFGFDIPAIRTRIEGVEGSVTCAGYAFTDTVKHRDAILEDVLTAKRRMELLSSSEESLRKVLLEERWRFDRQLLTPPLPEGRAPAASLEHKAGFSTLFPQTFTVDQCDTLLALWEFMYFCPSLYKTIDAYSLHDLVCSLTPPATPLTTYGQVVFDEVCGNLTSVLLSEVRCRADIKEETVWQNALMHRPVNNISWPTVALEAVRLTVLPMSPQETKNLLEMHSVPSHVVKQRDLLCLLLNHPVIDTFLVQMPAPAEGFTGPDPNKVTLDLRSMKDHFSSVERMVEHAKDEASIYFTTEAFCTALRAMFASVLEASEAPAKRVLHAHCLVAYLTALFKRWDVTVPDLEPSKTHPAPSAEDMAALLGAEKHTSWRFWGGYTLSNLDIPQGQIVSPSMFSNNSSSAPNSDFERRMRALDALEKTFTLLSRSEPEAWSPADRTAVYASLLDLCVVSREYVSSAHHRQSHVTNKLSSYTEAANVVPQHPPQIQVVTHTPPGTKCHFTGIEVDHGMERVQWVAVPFAYQGVGGMPAPKAPVVEAAPNNGRGMRSVNSTFMGPVALHVALTQVVTARETALMEARKIEDRVVRVLQPAIYEDPRTSPVARTMPRPGLFDTQRTLSYCSQPLGYDRLHNAYWLLSAQEVSTLFPYQPNSMAVTIGTTGLTGKPAPEPCVLMREPGGWWGFHNSSELPALLSSFSSDVLCERVLILKMIEKIAYTRCNLHKGVLTIRAMQRDWIYRRFRIEHWVHNVKLPTDNVSDVQMNRLLELVWARCCEVRHQLHNSSLFKLEDDPPGMPSTRAEKENLLRKQKKYRDTVTDDTFEHHLQRGWSRIDALQRLRQVAASTTATRLIADPSISMNLCTVMKRSPFVTRNDPSTERAGSGGAGDDDEGEAPAAVPRIENGSTPTAAEVAAGAGAGASSEPAPVPTEVPAVAPAAATEEGEAVEVQQTDETPTVDEDRVGESESALAAAPPSEEVVSEMESKTEAPASATEDDEPMEVEEVEVPVEAMPAEESSAPAPAILTTAPVVSEGANSANVSRCEATEAARELHAPAAEMSAAATTSADPTEADATAESESVVSARGATTSESAIPPVVEPSASATVSATEVPADASTAVTAAVQSELAAIVQSHARPLPDLRALIQATAIPGMEVKSKVIELLHLVTGELIRVFPSGKDAALFFSVSQSSISLCLHNTKTDFLGFRWKHYNGPAINFPAIAHCMPSRNICLAMQVAKHNRDRYHPETESELVRKHVEAEQARNPQLYRLSTELNAAVARVPGLPPTPPPPVLAQAVKPPMLPAHMRPFSTQNLDGYFGATPQTFPPHMRPFSAENPEGYKGDAPPTIPVNFPTANAARPMPSAPQRTIVGGYQPPRPGFAPAASLQPINTSTVLVSARMLKLKAELLNMFYLMPEKSLRLPELDAAAEKAIVDAGAEAANNIRTGLIKISSANKAAAEGQEATQNGAQVALQDGAQPQKPAMDLSTANVERLADKASRKAKRRLRRKLSMEKFLSDVQEATTPQQMLQSVLSLEYALPSMLMYKYSRAHLPATADTLGAVVVRLYALDRIIAYDEIRGVENNAAQCPFRLRMQFYPRCIVMSTCNRFIGHTGKCSTVMDSSGSRLPEFQDIMTLTRLGGSQHGYQPPPMRPMTAGSSNVSAAQAQMLANQRRLQYMQQMAAMKPKDEDQPLEEILKRMLTVRKELDIEAVVPYLPTKDITVMDWI